MKPRSQKNHEESRAALRAGVQQLRDELIDRSIISRSIRDSDDGDICSFDLCDLDAISEARGERATTLITVGLPAVLLSRQEVDSDSAGQRATQALKRLGREARLDAIENGASRLYLGTPFLTSRVAGRMVRAPLILYPVELVLATEGAQSWSLEPVIDTRPRVNRALVRLISAARGRHLSESELTELNGLAQQGADAVRDRLGELGLSTAKRISRLSPLPSRTANGKNAESRALHVDNHSVLGIYPQSVAESLRDYDEVLVKLDDRAADISRVFAAGAALFPADLCDGLSLSSTTHSVDEPVVIPLFTSDASQLQVIRKSRDSQLLFVDSPAGTGKSELIVNLLADALSRGEKVAVVCENRAALEEVSRLLQVANMSSVATLAYDALGDEGPCKSQLMESLSNRERSNREDSRVDETDILDVARQISDELMKRPTQLRQVHGPSSANLGELCALAAGLTVDTAPPIEGLESVATEQIDVIAKVVASSWKDRHLFASGSPWVPSMIDGTRASFSDLSESQHSATSEHIGAALTHAAWLRAHKSSESSKETAHACSYAFSALEVTSVEEFAIISALLERALETPEVLAEASEVVFLWRAKSPIVQTIGQRVSFELTTEFTETLALAEKLSTSAFRSLSPEWWRSKKQVSAGLTDIWPAKADTALTAEFLSQIRDRAMASDAWSRLDAFAESLNLSNQFDADVATATDWVNSLAASITSAERLLSTWSSLAAHKCVPESFDIGGFVGWRQALLERIEWHEKFTAQQDAIDSIRRAVPWVSVQPTYEELKKLDERWSNGVPAFREFDSRRPADAPKELVDRAICALMSMNPEPPPEDWADVIRKRWALDCVATFDMSEVEAEPEHSVGKKLSAIAETQATTRVRLIHEKLREMAADESAIQAEGFEGTSPRRIREELIREANETRAQSSLLSLVRKFAIEGLLNVIPVWLLSPGSMAALFPSETEFDLVIVDEATDCDVASGLPVLMRAKRAVVTGDLARLSNRLDATSDEGRSTSTDGGRKSEGLFDSTSLGVLSRARSEAVALEWHERCEREELFAFSNYALYEGSVRSVPSTNRPGHSPAFHWLTVAEGDEQGFENEREAELVVDTLYELLRRSDSPTIGIVTLTVALRNAVLDAIDERAASDGDFGRIWRRANTVKQHSRRPTVRCAHRADGQVRDTVVLAVGRLTTSSGTDPGVGTRGVDPPCEALYLAAASTCARREIYVVSSLSAESLMNEAAHAELPRQFRSWLQTSCLFSAGRYREAQSLLGEALPEKEALETRLFGWGRYVPLHLQIARALEDRGVSVDVELGLSPFQIPLAVVENADSARYKLAVLTDEGVGVASAYARYVHLPSLLEMRGWDWIRVDALQWLQNPAAVLDEIVERCE